LSRELDQLKAELATLKAENAALRGECQVLRDKGAQDKILVTFQESFEKCSFVYGRIYTLGISEINAKHHIFEPFAKLLL
jgi:hypothetical protein